MPLEMFPWIGEDTWDEFVRMKTSPAFQEKTMVGRDLAKKYINHHRMGTAGYAGSEPKWEKEDMEAQAAGMKPPFGDIKDKRARN